MRILQSHQWKLQPSASVPFIQLPLQRVLNTPYGFLLSNSEILKLNGIEGLDASTKKCFEEVSVYLVQANPLMNKKWEVISNTVLLFTTELTHKNWMCIIAEWEHQKTLR